MSQNLNVDDFWKRTYLTFPILLNKIEPGICPENDFQLFVNYIKSYQMENYIEHLVIDKIEELILQDIVPQFWNKFILRENEKDGFDRFKEAVNFLYHSLTMFLPIIERLESLRNILGKNRLLYDEKSLLGVLKTLVRSSLHSQMPLRSQIIIEDFYRISFKVFCYTDKSGPDHDESNEDIVQCEGCGLEMDHCQCNSIINIFHEINSKLSELDLLERLAGEVITSLIHVRIENHVAESCKGSFDVSYISILENWLEAVVMGWLTKVYNGDLNVTNTNTMETLKKFKQKLSHFLYETYTCTRIDQLFNIIIEYPDSQPAVEDLRICLAKTDLGAYLTEKLQRALETRLLHPGVNTPDVLTAYVAAIRALRQLDPTGVLLETVTKPVRQYLRNRDDTVRCVVSSLTEDGVSDLADELIRGDALHDEDHQSDDDIDNWETWQPDPVHVDPSKPCKSKRSSDIISMLVNVYGSKELFVNEYRTLLADRLLSQFCYNTEKEIRYLELLKRRFGESQLHFCEVMLKDIYDSKRINAILHSDPNLHLDKLEFSSTALILSAQFWPPFKEETLELPSKVKEHLDIYTKAFETLKGNRTLCWKPHLGTVVIDIELKDRKINLTVTPIHATIIWHFQTKTQWTIDELSQTMHVPSSILRRKITYWQSQGLLREISADTFLLMEENNSRTKGNAPTEVLCDDEETESVMASAHDQREEELQVFWSYIVGMLTNLESMPLERIHQMLKMFASQGPGSVECSLHELRLFLDRKVREHKLLFTGVFYKLPKP